MKNDAEFIRPEQESTKNEKEIEIINKLNIGPYQKAEIILVILGLKPATELYLYQNNDDEKNVESALNQTKLVFARKEITDQKKSKKLKARYAIAQQEATLEELSKAESGIDNHAYGKLMGYPESAIEAFENNDLLPESEYPDMTDIIFTFKLSKKSWREELEWLREWSEAIKESAPGLYKKLAKK